MPGSQLMCPVVLQQPLLELEAVAAQMRAILGDRNTPASGEVGVQKNFQRREWAPQQIF